MKYLTDVDMNHNKISNLVLENSSGSPSTYGRKTGEILYDSSGNAVKVFNGTAWVDVGDYELPTASTDTLGGVKIDGDSISIDESGIISTTLSPSNVYTKTEIDEKIGNNEPYIDTENNALVLPASSKYTIEDTALVINL